MTTSVRSTRNSRIKPLTKIWNHLCLTILTARPLVRVRLETSYAARDQIAPVLPLAGAVILPGVSEGGVESGGERYR